MRVEFLVYGFLSIPTTVYGISVNLTNGTIVPNVPILSKPSNSPLNFTSLEQHIAIVQNVEDAMNYDGLVYIKETGEVCSGDESVKTTDVDFQSMNVDFDIEALPKFGKKKYCVSNVRNTRVQSQPLLRAPVSPCLDSSLGDGGSITKGISISVSLSGSIDASLSIPIVNAITLDSSINAGVSVGLSFSHSCTAAPGDSIQMWVTPIVGLTDFEFRSYNKWAGGKHGFSDSKRVYDFTFPVGGFQPAVECFKGQYVDCGALTTTKFVLENEELA